MSGLFPLKVQSFGPGWLVDDWPAWAPKGYGIPDFDVFTADDVAWLDDMWARCGDSDLRRPVIFGWRNPALSREMT